MERVFYKLISRECLWCHVEGNPYMVISDPNQLPFELCAYERQPVSVSYRKIALDCESRRVKEQNYEAGSQRLVSLCSFIIFSCIHVHHRPHKHRVVLFEPLGVQSSWICAQCFQLQLLSCPDFGGTLWFQRDTSKFRKKERLVSAEISL